MAADNQAVTRLVAGRALTGRSLSGHVVVYYTGPIPEHLKWVANELLARIEPGQPFSLELVPGSPLDPIIEELRALLAGSDDRTRYEVATVLLDLAGPDLVADALAQWVRKNGPSEA